MSFAQHTYSDYVVDVATGNVGRIIDEHGSSYQKRLTIDWYKSRVTESRCFFDLITEYEYYKVVDPERCGPDINELVQTSLADAQEDFFTGGIYRNSIYKPPNEDFF